MPPSPCLYRSPRPQSVVPTHAIKERCDHLAALSLASDASAEDASYTAEEGVCTAEEAVTYAQPPSTLTLTIRGDKRARPSAPSAEAKPETRAMAIGMGEAEAQAEAKARTEAAEARLRKEEERQARAKLMASLKPRTTPAHELTIPSSVKIHPGPAIGDGAYGNVYLLKDYPDVVLKRVELSRRIRNEPARLRRNRIIMREVELMRVIGPHPNIIRFVRKPILRKHYMDLVLPRYDESLVEYIGMKGVSHPRAARIMLQLMSALQACHSVDVIHRDVKPGNILVDRAREQIVLADFGLAKRMVRGRVDPPPKSWGWDSDEDSYVSSATDSDADDEPDPEEYVRKHEANKLRRRSMRRDEIFPSQEVVTVGYRAPELVENHVTMQVILPGSSHSSHSGQGPVRYGPEIDVFAAGCIYAELLTGVRTFDGIKSESAEEMKKYSKLFNNFYSYVEIHRDRIYPGKEWLAFTQDEFDVWMPMMARDPARRCTSGKALAGIKLLCEDYAELRFLQCGAA